MLVSNDNRYAIDCNNIMPSVLPYTVEKWATTRVEKKCINYWSLWKINKATHVGKYWPL